MTRRALAVAALLLAACGSIHTTVRPTVNHLAGVQRVAIVMIEDGAFTVVKERAKATATGPCSSNSSLVINTIGFGEIEKSTGCDRND
jgi:hypothetical protein